MTEAEIPVVDWVRSQPNHFRIWAYCHVHNPASARVLEKVGMRFEGALRRWATFPNLGEEPQDVRAYAWTR